MKYYNKFLVSQSDRFNAANFPMIDEELSVINEKIESCPDNSKVEIIMSFLKGQTLQTTWTKTNPALAELIKSKSLSSGDIKELFDSSVINPAFREDLETYIKGKLDDMPVSTMNDM